jgi:CRISPR type IV-associated protein Csf3
MERSTPARYAEIHAKRNEPVPLDSKRLLTDRSAYISFLEVQLERVTTSCLTVQGFAERIEQLQAQVTTADERWRTSVGSLRSSRRMVVRERPNASRRWRKRWLSCSGVSRAGVSSLLRSGIP